jgi:hypothetical protein
MSKEIINFYEKLNIKGNKLPKNYSKPGIMHNSMILALGGTATLQTGNIGVLTCPTGVALCD